MAVFVTPTLPWGPQSFVSAYETDDRKIDVLEFPRIAKAMLTSFAILFLATR